MKEGREISWDVRGWEGLYKKVCVSVEEEDEDEDEEEEEEEEVMEFSPPSFFSPSELSASCF